MNMHVGEVELCLEGHAEQVNSLAITSKGDMLASGSQDGTITLWDAYSGELKGKLQGHDGPVFSVDFNPFEPKRLVSGSGDGLVKVWNTQDMVERHSFSGHKDYVLCVKYSPDGHYVASGGGDVSIKFWSTAALRCVADITGHDGKGKCKCTPSVKVGQVDLRCTHEGHSNAISCLAFNPNSSVIASGSWDTTVRLWSIRIGPDGVFLDPAGKICPFEHAVLREHENWVKTLCFTRMGDVLATAGNDASIKMWDVKTGALIRNKVF
jgi:WD40 repeat protein